MQLVLSLFPGIGMLDQAFEEAGFCVVRGPDYLWGGDIKKFNPPAGRFDGIIGGPPCQAFSSLAHLVRHNGHEPKFGNLIPEYERCVIEAQPQWFLMENVPAAPIPIVENYGVHSFLLNNRELGEEQNRKRRLSFGWRGERRLLLIDTVVFQNPKFKNAASGGACGRGSLPPMKLNSNGVKTKTTMPKMLNRKEHFQHLKRLQGLSEDFDLPPFTVEAKCKAVGNGVPFAMGRALAKAVLESLQREDAN